MRTIQIIITWTFQWSAQFFGTALSVPRGTVDPDSFGKSRESSRLLNRSTAAVFFQRHVLGARFSAFWTNHGCITPTKSEHETSYLRGSFFYFLFFIFRFRISRLTETATGGFLFFFFERGRQGGRAESDILGCL